MNLRRALVVGLALLCLCGCGPIMLKTKGRVLKDGAPFLPGEGEYVRVTFVPIFEDGKNVEDLYVAQYDGKNGTFQVAGKDLRGMPPGKYRVAVELDKHRSDQLHGQFNAENSPFVFTVDSSTREIVVDLAKPPQ
jgi:hypothetical protein